MSKEEQFAPYRKLYQNGEITKKVLEDKYFEVFMKPECQRPDLLPKTWEYKVK